MGHSRAFNFNQFYRIKTADSDRWSKPWANTMTFCLAWQVVESIELTLPEYMSIGEGSVCAPSKKEYGGFPSECC